MDTVQSTRFSLVDSLRDYVLVLPALARETADREYAEVEAEYLAFGRFEERLAEIDAESSRPSASAPTPRPLALETHSRSVETIRDAFRQTVMSVDHYEETYGESLEEFASAELSPEVAAALRQEQTTPFGEKTKTIVSTAVQRALDRRDAFLEVLERERDSLEASHTALAAALDEHEADSSVRWHRGDLTDRLDDIAETRQETLQTRDSSAPTDGHDLCSYLYEESDWTYPVLTAVTRFRSAVA